MKNDRFTQLEIAIRRRNSALADRLQPGLTEVRVRTKLKKGGVEGKIDPIISVFSWKNGSALDTNITQEQASPFPGSIYIFMDLEMMVGHYRDLEACAVYHPRYSEVVRRYFPLFWDGSSSWLSVDLDRAGNSGVVIIDTDSEQIVQEAYHSFEDFLKDAIRANEENSNLNCF